MAVENRSQEETQVRQLIDHWLEAVRAMDIDGVMPCYASEIVSFDVIPPLEYV